ncbi:MAG: extracellular solute-binding protein [Aestuariivirga sp.]|uniref:extracellular solute-binding protein n=1 Tax=Aestuariivirga sp. TaxID=2650926 RepID=UPI0038D20F0E
MRRIATALLAISLGAAAAAAEPRHGLSVFGDLKYPAGFAHFDYVNPDAPKGGKMALIGPTPVETFDSFNGYILKGDAVQGFELMFDSLMAAADDEPDARYGLVAETADLAADRKSVTFKLRGEARFADGSGLTAEDVCDSFRLLSTEGHERIRITIRDVEACDVISPNEVRYRFKGERTRDLPLTVAALPIFSKAYYAKVDFSKTTLEPPLGSGPYAVKSFKPGEYVTYGRRADYWAKDLPVNKGRHNFDELRFDYFRDRAPAFEALKSGVIDLREEFTSRDWATAYDFPALADGRVIKAELPDDTPSGAQGFFLNMRREKFQDIRVRKALNLAFDFEWTNKNLFFGLYTRTASFFERSPLKAEGAPPADELALLEPYRDSLRPEVFAAVELPPVSDGSGQDRKLLREASRLLDEAGWTADGTMRRNARGETLDIEFLVDGPVFERVLAPYVKNLKLLGINATIRTVDPAQYQQRLEPYDYDVTIGRFMAGLTPGDGLRIFFGSESATKPGTYNLSGVASPAIDALIDKIVEAKTRQELDVAGRALDRVLRAEQFWVPNWYKGSHWLAYWDKFGQPPVKPKYDRGITDTWWYDDAKAKRIANGN